MYILLCMCQVTNSDPLVESLSWGFLVSKWASCYLLRNLFLCGILGRLTWAKHLIAIKLNAVSFWRVWIVYLVMKNWVLFINKFIWVGYFTWFMDIDNWFIVVRCPLWEFECICQCWKQELFEFEFQSWDVPHFGIIKQY